MNINRDSIGILKWREAMTLKEIDPMQSLQSKPKMDFLTLK